MAKKKINLIKILGGGEYRLDSKMTPNNEMIEVKIDSIEEDYDEKAKQYFYTIRDKNKRILLKIRNCPIIIYYNV
jgi:hypothetical protein